MAIIVICNLNKTDSMDSADFLEITKDDEKVILEYLDKETNNIARSSEGKMYSAFKLLGTEKNKIYIWLVKIEYLKKGGQITHMGGGAVSLPVVLYARKDENGILITRHKFPSDGVHYGKSIMKLFPLKVREKFSDIDYDEKERLKEITLIRAKDDL
jgi:hypothetical protein